MADVKLNFNSQWPTVQVAKVIHYPEDKPSETTSAPYDKKFKHGLGYPPLVIGMGGLTGRGPFNVMMGMDVDETYVYMVSNQYLKSDLECIVIYTLNITEPFDYTNYESVVGSAPRDSSIDSLDLRNFLLHSRAVGPMVLNVTNKDFVTLSDSIIEYTSPLNYPTFSFGYMRMTEDIGILSKGIWMNVALAGQAWPVMYTNGYTSRIGNTVKDGIWKNDKYVPGTGSPMADKGSIITLRNPAIITDNTVEVTI